MTMDEACLILNVKKDSPMEQVLKVRTEGTLARGSMLITASIELRTPIRG